MFFCSKFVKIGLDSREKTSEKLTIFSGKTLGVFKKQYHLGALRLKVAISWGLKVKLWQFCQNRATRN